MSYGDSGNAGGPELDFTVLPAGRSLALDLGTLSASKVVWPRGGVLLGWSVRESAGAAAHVDLLDGGDSSGPFLGAIPLAANAGLTVWFGPEGIAITSHIYANVGAGSIVGCLYIRTPSVTVQ